MTRRGWFLSLGLLTTGCAVFVLWPGLDLYASGLFWRPVERFYLVESWWAVALYRAVPVATWVTVCGALLWLIISLVRPRMLPWGAREAGFVIAVFALGPGLLVNVVFKDNWGRARPRDVTQFGGTRQFTPPMVLADQCDKNCSFTAGHPAAAFALASLAWLVGTRRRRTILLLAVLAGAAAGAGRVVQGAHFTSDVLFSALIMFLTISLMTKVLPHDPTAEDPG